MGPDSTPPSVATQLATLRRLLLDADPRDETGMWFVRAGEGAVPLVVHTDAADALASLVVLKADVEERRGTRMRVVVAGGAEAHLVARELGAAGVGVVLLPVRAAPGTWDTRRT